MAYLAMNSKFTPYSLGELLSLAQQATEAHHRMENELSEYDIKGKGISAYLDEVKDKPYYDQYTNWNRSVNEVSSLLAKEGLKNIDREVLLGVKRDYNSLASLMPAIEKRERQKAEYDRMITTDRSLQMRVNPYVEGLDKYVNGNSPVLSGVSGEDVMKDAMAIAAARSSQRFSYSASLDPNTNNQYYRFMEAQGYSREKAEEFLQSNDADEIIEAILTARGADDLLGTQKETLRDYGRLGLEKGLSYKPDIKYQANMGYRGNSGDEDPSSLPYDSQTSADRYEWEGELYQDYKDFYNKYVIPFSGGPIKGYNNALEFSDAYLKKYNISNQENKDFKSKYGIDVEIGDLASRLEILNNPYSVKNEKTSPTYGVRTHKPPIEDKEGNSIKYFIKDNGIIEVYNKDNSVNTELSEALTDAVNRAIQGRKEARQLYNDTFSYLHPDYRPSVIINSEVAKLKEKLQLSEDATLFDIEKALANHPESRKEQRVILNVARPGVLGQDFRNVLGGDLLSGIMNRSTSSKWTGYDPKKDNINIYYLDRSNRKTDKIVNNVDDIFELSEDGSYITNITGIQANADTISNGYIKLSTRTTSGNKQKINNIAIPIELFGNIFELFNTPMKDSNGNYVPISYLDAIKESVNRNDRNLGNAYVDSIIDNVAKLITENRYTVPSVGTQLPRKNME